MPSNPLLSDFSMRKHCCGYVAIIFNIMWLFLLQAQISFLNSLNLRSSFSVLVSHRYIFWYCGFSKLSKDFMFCLVKSSQYWLVWSVASHFFVNEEASPNRQTHQSIHPEIVCLIYTFWFAQFCGTISDGFHLTLDLMMTTDLYWINETKLSLWTWTPFSTPCCCYVWTCFVLLSLYFRSFINALFKWSEILKR